MDHAIADVWFSKFGTHGGWMIDNEDVATNESLNESMDVLCSKFIKTGWLPSLRIQVVELWLEVELLMRNQVGATGC